MPYWPAQEQGDGANYADALTELLICVGAWDEWGDGYYVGCDSLQRTEYGNWTPYHPGGVTVGNHFYHDMALRSETLPQLPFQPFRESAVAIENNPGSGTNRFYDTGWVFTPNALLDLGVWDYCRFYLGAQNKNTSRKNITGNAWLRFIDVNGYTAEKQFGFAPDVQGMQLITVWMNELTANPFFHLNEVQSIRIILELTGIGEYSWEGYNAYLDGGPFFYTAQILGQITVDAADIDGVVLHKLIQLGSVSKKTSFSFSVTPGNYPLTVLDTAGFLQWADGITALSRTVNIPASPPVAMTAIYVSGTPPNGDGGDNVDWIWIIAGLGIIGVSATAFYLFRSKKRKGML